MTRRRVGLAAAALSLLAGVPARPAAQASAAGAAGRQPPVACRVPAERVEWTDRVLLATLGPSDSAERSLLAVPVRQLFLDEITARLRARLVPKNDSGGVTLPAGQLPAADSLYSPLVLLTRIHLTLYGNGDIRDVHVDTTFHHALSPSGGDSLFNEHAREAVERAAAEGAIGPFSERGAADSTRLYFEVRSDLVPAGDTTTAAWPLFRMQLPLDRHAAPLPGERSPVRYPEYARRQGFEATVIMQFVVDEFGRPVASTIKPFRRPGDIPKRFESVYQEFIDEVTRGIPRSRYQPAEMLGCRVPQLVLQPFSFGLQR